MPEVCDFKFKLRPEPVTHSLERNAFSEKQPKFPHPKDISLHLLVFVTSQLISLSDCFSLIQIYVELYLEKSIYLCCVDERLLWHIVKMTHEFNFNPKWEPHRCQQSFCHSDRLLLFKWWNLAESLLMQENIQHVLKSRNVLLLSWLVYRLVGCAQTPLRRHGELGPECLRGAEDPVGRRRVVLILSDGTHHGGSPRDLSPGRQRTWWLRHYTTIHTAKDCEYTIEYIL